MFKKGDKVVCVNNINRKEFLVEKKVYVVEKCKHDYVVLKDVGSAHSIRRFVLVKNQDYVVRDAKNMPRD